MHLSVQKIHTDIFYPGYEQEHFYEVDSADLAQMFLQCFPGLAPVVGEYRASLRKRREAAINEVVSIDTEIEALRIFMGSENKESKHVGHTDQPR